VKGLDVLIDACAKLRALNASVTSSTPNMIAYAAITHSRASAPAPGIAINTTPNPTEARPDRMRTHSPSISFRRAIAAAILRTPVAIDQIAM